MTIQFIAKGNRIQVTHESGIVFGTIQECHDPLIAADYSFKAGRTAEYFATLEEAQAWAVQRYSA